MNDEQKKRFSISCSDQTLGALRNDTHINQNSHKLSDQNNIETEINNINTRLLSTNDSINKLSETIPKQYDEQFRNLAQIGIAAYITSISIIIAGIAFLGNVMIKDQVMEAHNKELRKSRRTLKYMIKTAHPQLSSSIHSSLSASFTKLYAELDPNKKRHLYNPYVSAAVDMAAMGYRKSQEMYKLIMGSETKNDRKVSDEQSIVMDVALNNYAYFLSDMTTLKNEDNSLTEDAKRAKDEIRRLLPSIESARDRIAELKKSNKHNIDKLKEIEDYEFCFINTIMWVKLHIGRESYREFDAELNTLKTSQLYTESQRRRIMEQIERNQKYFPELWHSQSLQGTETQSVNNHSSSGS